MVGLLRDETKPPAAPAPGLGPLGDLITGARAAGLTVEEAVSGDLSRLPSLVSQPRQSRPAGIRPHPQSRKT